MFGELYFCAVLRVCVFVVLVKSMTQVKITDFGLAKVLEHNQEQVYGTGGKVQSSSHSQYCLVTCQTYIGTADDLIKF